MVHRGGVHAGDVGAEEEGVESVGVKHEAVAGFELELGHFEVRVRDRADEAADALDALSRRRRGIAQAKACGYPKKRTVLNLKTIFL